MCSSFCESVASACRHDFFTTDSNGNTAPCRERDAVCVRLEEAAPDGTALCTQAGFTASPDDSAYCYSGQQAVNSLAATPRRGHQGPGTRALKVPWSWRAATQAVPVAAILAVMMVALYVYRRKLLRRWWSRRSSGMPAAARERILLVRAVVHR